jgi:hypothetical protein
MNRAKILAAVGTIVCTLAYVLVPQLASADPMPPYTSGVQRMEHLGLKVDFTRCARMDATVGNDGGTMLKTRDGGLPPSNLNWICSADKAACIRQGPEAVSCQYAVRVPEGGETKVLMFSAEANGSQPIVKGVGFAVTSAIECCPVIPTVTNNR